SRVKLEEYVAQDRARRCWRTTRGRKIRAQRRPAGAARSNGPVGRVGSHLRDEQVADCGRRAERDGDTVIPGNGSRGYESDLSERRHHPREQRRRQEESSQESHLSRGARSRGGWPGTMAPHHAHGAQQDAHQAKEPGTKKPFHLTISFTPSPITGRL